MKERAKIHPLPACQAWIGDEPNEHRCGKPAVAVYRAGDDTDRLMLLCQEHRDECARGGGDGPCYDLVLVE